MTRVCETCAAEKADSHFRKSGRGRKKICVECEGGGTPVSAEPTPVMITGPKLEILPGFGFRASLEDGRLSIEQDDADGKTDNVTLSKTEALMLFTQYGEWAGILGAA